MNGEIRGICNGSSCLASDQKRHERESACKPVQKGKESTTQHISSSSKWEPEMGLTKCRHSRNRELSARLKILNLCSTRKMNLFASPTLSTLTLKVDAVILPSPSVPRRITLKKI